MVSYVPFSMIPQYTARVSVAGLHAAYPGIDNVGLTNPAR